MGTMNWWLWGFIVLVGAVFSMWLGVQVAQSEEMQFFTTITGTLVFCQVGRLVAERNLP